MPNGDEKSIVHDIAYKLLGEFEKPDEYSYELRKKLIMELLVRSDFKTSGDLKSDDNNLDVEYIVEYINKNYSKKITLQELADLDYVSYGYMSYQFKKHTGMTISDYIKYVRIENAKQMLAETNESITVISEKCGFNDSNYFSSVFKKREKVSPKQFRKQFL